MDPIGDAPSLEPAHGSSTEPPCAAPPAEPLPPPAAALPAPEVPRIAPEIVAPPGPRRPVGEDAGPEAPRRTPWAELAAVVALCVLGDVVLYGGAGGLGFLALFGLAPVLVLLGRSRAGLVVSPRLAAIGGLLALVALRCVWQWSAWTVLCGAALLFAFAITAGTRDGYLPELVVSSAGSMLSAPLTARGWLRDLLGRLTGGRRTSLPWVTVVVPVAVVALFALVFVAANPVLERWADTAWDAVTGGAIFPSPLRVLLWGACAWLAAAWLRPFHAELFTGATGDLHRLDLASTGPYRSPPQTSTTREVAFATSRNVLVGVNALFLLYVALDAVHLWAGRPPAGMIHTAYAHRGAAWLTVALLLCTIVVSAIFRGALNFEPRARTLRILAYVWLGQGLVLAAGTLRRIELYVDDSGLTNLRIVGFLGSTLVAAGLVLVAIKVARQKTVLWLVRRQLDAFGVTLVLFLVAPTDALVTAHNVGRIQAGERRPLLHLTEQRLTAEGAPGLLPLLGHPDPVVRRGVAALLAGLDRTLERDERESLRWTEQELARPRARAAIARVRSRIDALLVRPPGSEAVAGDWAASTELRRRACAANDLPCGR